MDLILEFETRELVKNKEESHYNYIAHDVKGKNIGITRIIEIYDDVSDSPRYELGTVVGGKFNFIMMGEGDPVPNGQEDCGGVRVQITISRPDLSVKL